MEKRSYSYTYVHYFDMTDAYKPTSTLFGFISWNFLLPKSVMAFLMAIPIFLFLLVFSGSLIGLCIIFMIYIIFSIEYNRVYDYRYVIQLKCITLQIIAEEDLKECFIYEGDSDYIDQNDIDSIFEDALQEHSKPTFFKYVRKHLFPK